MTALPFSRAGDLIAGLWPGLLFSVIAPGGSSKRAKSLMSAHHAMATVPLLCDTSYLVIARWREPARDAANPWRRAWRVALLGPLGLHEVVCWRDG